MQTLNGTWLLSCTEKNLSQIQMQVPGDVHTALLDAKLIPDPYFGSNENETQWVHQVEWEIQRTFEIPNLSHNSMILSLEMVDTFASFYINDIFIKKTNNCFEFYHLDIKPYLIEGQNKIKIIFHDPTKEANNRAERLLPDVYPYSKGNNKVPNMNLIRKPQFQSGWDWGPCLIPCGIYKPIKLIPIRHYYLVDISAEQFWEDEFPRIKIEAHLQCYHKSNEDTSLIFNFNGVTHEKIIKPIDPMKFIESFEITPNEFELWNIYEIGNRKLYEFSVSIEDQIITKKIGIRKLKVNRNEDHYGTTFEFELNNKIVNVKGANFIPPDSIPSRITYDKCYSLIEDVVHSNMNMIRVWGGGYYPDFLYDICDEFGVLVWQDLMFSCAQYPTTKEFLREVKKELKCQLIRNKHHSSIVIWCGDNENFLAINWFNFTESYKKWLREQYKVFNQFLKENVEKYDKNRLFWPSSPSDGTFDYEGKWFSQNKGDIHYWEVWHGGKPFESFYDVKPRFCSEFGYQSYPSFPTLFMFLTKDQFDIESKGFENHQKNKSGNKLIKNMFNHYFKEPKTFEHCLYLSQVQQSIAIKMGCEFWRTLKPINRGMLYWQLNDCWPTSSWSSIEYCGRWKQLQYHVKRFYNPILVTFYEDKDENVLKCIVVNDKYNEIEGLAMIKWINFEGVIINEWNNIKFNCESDNINIIWQLNVDEFEYKRNLGFFYVSILVNNEEINNFHFVTSYKNCNILNANIKMNVENDINKNETKIVLETDKPSFFVHLESENVLKFSDSSFVLLPNNKKHVTCNGIINEESITIYHLGQVGN